MARVYSARRERLFQRRPVSWQMKHEKRFHRTSSSVERRELFASNAMIGSAVEIVHCYLSCRWHTCHKDNFIHQSGNPKRAWNRAPRRLRLRRLRPPRRKGIPPLVRTGRHRTCPLLLIHYKATARNASFLRRFTKSDAKRRPSSVLLFAYTASAMISTTSGDGFRGKDRSMSKNSSTALETKTYHSLEDRATARGSTAKTRGWAAAAS